MITGSQPRVDSAAWFASAIGPNFNPRECTPDNGNSNVSRKDEPAKQVLKVMKERDTGK